MKGITHWLTGVLLLSLGICGCGWGNELSADGILDSLEIQVEGQVANTETQKVDILWVIDNSVSMCQEQNSLGANVTNFLDLFLDLELDLRMAVVTTDALTSTESGAFHSELAPPFPPNCFEKVVYPCLLPSDASVPDACIASQEVKDGAQGAWVCEPPPQNVASNMTNPNGSINSTCRFKCEDDADCVAQFEDESAECKSPGGDNGQRGCLIPPVSAAGCVGVDLPLYVDSEKDNLDLFPCLAVVGALQDSNPQLEQGLNTAMWALDTNPLPGAPDRSLQASDFVRSDAYQIIIFISDEDDCSLAPGIALQKELQQTCACLPTTEEGGPLEAVDTFTSKLKSINPDPSRVLVAAIVGDVVQTGSVEVEEESLFCAAEDPVCVAAKRDAYTASKCGKKFTDRNTYVCESVSGKADYGSRYLELVRQFGSNGVSANICDDQGFGPALEAIAKEILTRIVRVCLPEPIKPGTTLQVKKVSPDGTIELLEENAQDGYVLESAGDCPDLGGGVGKAVFFNEVLDKGQTVSLSYQAPIVAVE